MFFAGTHINVERDGKLVALSPGDPCPEAASWDQDVLARCMKVGQVVDMEKAPKVKGVLVRKQAEQEALARAEHQNDEPVKPTSTHEAFSPVKTKKGKSSADASRAASKQAKTAAAAAAPVPRSGKMKTREVAGMEIPIRNAPKRVAPPRHAS